MPWTPEDPTPTWLEADRRPDGVDDATVEAVGKLSEAVEWVERARGRLYDFHQMSGRADLLAGEAAEALEHAGHHELARELREHVIGRNVIDGRWTFQIIEEYDAVYWSVIRDFLRHVQESTLDGRHHVFESEMKDQRRSETRPGHARRPAPGVDFRSSGSGS